MHGIENRRLMELLKSKSVLNVYNITVPKDITQTVYPLKIGDTKSLGIYTSGRVVDLFLPIPIPSKRGTPVQYVYLNVYDELNEYSYIVVNIAKSSTDIQKTQVIEVKDTTKYIRRNNQVQMMNRYGDDGMRRNPYPERDQFYDREDYHQQFEERQRRPYDGHQQHQQPHKQQYKRDEDEYERYNPYEQLGMGKKDEVHRYQQFQQQMYDDYDAFKRVNPMKQKEKEKENEKQRKEREKMEKKRMEQ